MRNIDNYTNNYSVQSFEDYQVMYRRKKVLEQIRCFHPGSLLEIGVGLDPIFQYVEDVEFTIVEPSEKFYENARKLSEVGYGGRVHCLQGFFEDIAEGLDKKFDMIICSSLLHEVEFPDKFLGAVSKVCNENTVVHINVPNANSLHRLLALESGIISNVKDKSRRNELLQQQNVFDLDTLSQLVEKNGMHIIESGSYFIKPFTHRQMYAMLEQGIIEEKVLDGFYYLEKYMPGLGSEIYVNCNKADEM